jgi:hypothetical protein
VEALALGSLRQGGVSVRGGDVPESRSFLCRPSRLCVVVKQLACTLLLVQLQISVGFATFGCGSRLAPRVAGSV